jgi:hypothetical protein
MLGGLATFVSFCALVALLVEPAGVIRAFLLATGAASLVQFLVARAYAPLSARPSPARAV